MRRPHQRIAPTAARPIANGSRKSGSGTILTGGAAGGSEKFPGPDEDGSFPLSGGAASLEGAIPPGPLPEGDGFAVLPDALPKEGALPGWPEAPPEEPPPGVGAGEFGTPGLGPVPPEPGPVSDAAATDCGGFRGLCTGPEIGCGGLTGPGREGPVAGPLTGWAPPPVETAAPIATPPAPASSSPIATAFERFLLSPGSPGSEPMDSVPDGCTPSTDGPADGHGASHDSGLSSNASGGSRVANGSTGCRGVSEIRFPQRARASSRPSVRRSSPAGTRTGFRVQ